LHESLARGTVPATDETSPFAERLRLYRNLSAALERRNHAGIEDAFRRFLGHRMLYVLPAHQDLPLAAIALESLSSKSSPRAELLRGLLRDGLSDGHGGVMQGLQRALLEKREKLSDIDFHHLAERIRLLSEKAGVIHDDFVARVEESSGEIVTLPENLSEPMLILGRWYVEPEANGRVRGVEVRLESIVSEVSGEMRRRGLFVGGGRLQVDLASVLPVSRIAVHVVSPTFDRETVEAGRNQRIKAAWGILCGLLAALLIGLGVLWVRQEKRYVDLKADFVATVSHELRTPLSSVRLLGETLERRLASSPEARDYPARIVREVDRLSFLVENILSFNRIARGGVRPQLSDVNVGEVVDSVHRDRGDGRDVTLVTDGASAAWLKGDPELLYLLFSNLYENACRYSSRRPVQISLGAKVRGHDLDLSFADNGEGLPAGDEARVFDAFYRPARDAGSPRKGSGLGLAICRRIVVLHGGSIRVVKSDSEGTTFGMTFPLS
ncbi:MAG TPA: HAMP domain-containing sensor histidine kinase, partial [Thermoanaerobaculia bacterium]|nr:HAMP domain-containing sensor histidine kinase [Thermoanaerobaculia bacterium]